MHSPSDVPTGIDAYRFGMSRAQVWTIPSCSGYRDGPTPTRLVGDGFELFGNRSTIKFDFVGGDSLGRIEIGTPLGQDRAVAQGLLDGIVSAVQQTYGPVKPLIQADVTSARGMLDHLDAQASRMPGANVETPPFVLATPGLAVHVSGSSIRSADGMYFFKAIVRPA